MLASRFIIGWKNIVSFYDLKRTADDAESFQSCHVSDAFDSIMLARLTYARALPLPPSSCCPLFLFLHLLLKKSSRRCDKLFSVLPSLQGPQFPYCWRDLLIRGRYRYLHRRAVLYSFVFTFVILLQVKKRLRAEVPDGAVGQVPHAVNQHQNKLLERNVALVETDNLHSHTPIAFAVFHPA